MNREEIAQLAMAWDTFIKTHPDALRLKPEELTSKYGSQAAEWQKASELLPTLTQETSSSSQQEVSGSHIQGFSDFLAGATAIPFLFKRKNVATPQNTPPNQKPEEILENDPEYQETESLCKTQWLKDHPDHKDFSSKEGIDYIYGSENLNSSSLRKDTLSKIKEYSDQYNLYEGNKSNLEYGQYKKYKKYYDLLQKYEKKESEFEAYQNPSEDPHVARTEKLIREETEARFKLLSKDDHSLKREAIETKVKEKSWDEFASTHSNRAKTYAQKHDGIGKAYDRWETQKMLSEYKEKEIKYVEKSHRTPDPSPNEAATHLESIIIQEPQTSIGLVSQYGTPLASGVSPSPDESVDITSPQRAGNEKLEENGEGREFLQNISDRLINSRGFGTRVLNNGANKGIEGVNRLSSLFRSGAGLGRAGGMGGALGGGAAAAGGATGAAGGAAAAGGTAVTTGATGAAAATIGLPVLIGILIGIVLIVIIVILNPDQQSDITEASPIPTVSPISTSLDYTIPFRDFSVPVPDGTKEKIKSQFPSGKVDENFDIIVRESKNNKWNPMFVLALWIEESGAQSASSYSDALGCAPGQPTTDINISLKCLFDNFPIGRYSDDKFADFMCVYGGDGFHMSPCTFNIENPDFPKNIKQFYSLLVPSGKGALQIINTSTSSDCPIPNGKITTYSFDKDPQNGHCAPNYGSCTDEYSFCPTSGRRAKSIDMIGENGDKSVYLPTILGENVSWEYIQKLSVKQSEGGGNGYIFEARKGSDLWHLQLLHMGETTFSPNSKYPSNTLVGQYYNDHVHITVGKNIKNPLGSGTQNTNCDGGWMPAENICGSK